MSCPLIAYFPLTGKSLPLRQCCVIKSRSRFTKALSFFTMTRPPWAKSSSIKKKMVLPGLLREKWKSLQSADLNPIKHLWDKLEAKLAARADCATSLTNLTNELVAGKSAVPAASRQNFGQCFFRKKKKDFNIKSLTVIHFSGNIPCLVTCILKM